MNDVPLDARTLRDLAELLQAQGEDVLAELYGEAPVLLVRPLASTQTFLVGTTPDGTPTERIRSDERVKALDETQESAVRGEYTQLGQGANYVVPIRKSDRNPFVGVITVGRAANNDIILSTGNVSKLHAFIQQATNGWKVEDRGSTNGTMLDGVLLEPKTSHRLEYGSEVTFGGVGGLFVETNQLASLCRMVQPEE